MRRINSKVIAGALLAIQIAAAMPAAAFAGEIENPAVTQEQAETEAAVEETAEEDAEAANEESENEEDQAAADEQYFDEDQSEGQAAAPETEKEKSEPEKAAQGKAFDQSVTVDGVRINVKAEEGTFEDGAKLSVTRFPSSQLRQVENAIADARAKDTDAAFAYVFDIKVVGSDGSILKPAEGRKVKVTFEAEEMADSSLNAVVYHVVDASNNARAMKLSTTVNRNSKTAEAVTDGFSCYAVEFYRVGDADQTKADPEPVEEKKNNDGEEQKTEKTEKTDTIDKNKKSETVTPAKDSEKTKKAETSVEKEKKSEVKKSEVKKAETKKSASKKTASDQKKEKAKKETNKKSPKTGDAQNAVFWITMIVLAAVGLFGLIFTRRRI